MKKKEREREREREKEREESKNWKSEREITRWERKRRSAEHERACASFSGALVMEASVSARLGSRQYGRRRSTASSIRPGSPGDVLKIEKRAPPMRFAPRYHDEENRVSPRDDAATRASAERRRWGGIARDAEVPRWRSRTRETGKKKTGSEQRPLDEIDARSWERESLVSRYGITCTCRERKRGWQTRESIARGDTRVEQKWRGRPLDPPLDARSAIGNRCIISRFRFRWDLRELAAVSLTEVFASPAARQIISRSVSRSSTEERTSGMSEYR